MQKFSVGEQKLVKIGEDSLEEEIKRIKSGDYNTEEGIKKSLYSLKVFQALVNERHEAGYDRDEKLTEFSIFDGSYLLDTCGNTMEKVHDYAFQIATLPPADKICDVCQTGWDITNMRDKVVWDLNDKVSLENFEGKTLEDVQEFYDSKIDGIYRVIPQIRLRNDRFIDLSSRFPDHEHEDLRNMPKNQNGWVTEREGINEKYVVQNGDEVELSIWKFYHRVCNKAHLDKKYHKIFSDLLNEAGFNVKNLFSVKNEYWQGDHAEPWYVAQTDAGNLKIGWRKRVINIDWSDTNLSRGDKFADENVTKGSGMIHAWGYDKAKEYLTVLAQSQKS